MKSKHNSSIEKLTQNKLKEILYYDPPTGIFTWLERPIAMFSHCKYPERQCNAWNTRNSGKIAGVKRKDRKLFYIKIFITLNGDGKGHQAHRLAIFYMTGHWPPESVDHIDGDGTNNRMNNLRKVSDQENKKNRSIQINNSSGFNGVNWSERYKKWRVRIKIRGKDISGGYFINKEDAIAKRQELNILYGFHKNHGRKTQQH